MASLVSLVLYDLKHFDEVVEKWHDRGASELTIIDCVGTRGVDELVGRDIPMLPRIRDLLQSDDAPRRLIFSAVPDAVVDPLIEATTEILGDLIEPNNGILVVIPIARVLGLRPPERGEP